MGSRRKRNDFINFIIDATRDEKLAARFFKRKTPLGVHRFFQSEGYKDVPLNDCEDIYKVLKGMRGKGVSKSLKPVDTSDPSVRKGY